jgi:predicted nuclease of predicted toxin-antitoxin system
VRLLLDEMYTPAIAEGLRDRGHDVISVHERPDLVAAPDSAIFAAAQAEERAIVTNNVRDFMSLAHDALQTRSTFYGLVLTSDRSLPRSKRMIGTFIRRLDKLLNQEPSSDALAGQTHWLTPTPPENS